MPRGAVLTGLAVCKLGTCLCRLVLLSCSESLLGACLRPGPCPRRRSDQELTVQSGEAAPKQDT